MDGREAGEMTDEAFERQLAAAVREIDAQEDPPHTLETIVAITPEFFDACDYVGVSLVERGRAHTPAATNEKLRKVSTGVATRSLHMDGRAIDVRLPGCSTSKLRDYALQMRAGGVGYYAKSDFVPLDTGRVRSWNG